MEHKFLIIDVFTAEPFGGSRLNLFPESESLSSELMQKIAMELGVGETAFLTSSGQRDSSDQEESSRSGLRVFTPTAEIPFGGHSVLGATFAMDHLGQGGTKADGVPFVWELEAGHYPVVTRSDGDVVTYSLLQDDPVFMGQYFHRGKVAKALGIAEDEITITGLPCEVISTGLPIHVVPLSSLQAMAQINLRHREAEAIARDLGFGDMFVFTCETVAEDATVHCRMFAPFFGIPEDAASGAASGALIAYLIKHRLVKWQSKVRVVIEQGLEMGRPSRIVAVADVVKGQARNVHVGGQCVLVGSGSLSIP